MEQQTIPMREMQRNYKKVIESAKRARQPLFLGAHGKPQAVVMDIATFRIFHERFQQLPARRRWQGIERALDKISASGRKNVNLSAFVHADRSAH